MTITTLCGAAGRIFIFCVNNVEEIWEARWLLLIMRDRLTIIMHNPPHDDPPNCGEGLALGRVSNWSPLFITYSEHKYFCRRIVSYDCRNCRIVVNTVRAGTEALQAEHHHMLSMRIPYILFTEIAPYVLPTEAHSNILYYLFSCPASILDTLGKIVPHTQSKTYQSPHTNKSVRQRKGSRSYADVDGEHTTIMAIMDVCGGGLLACLDTGGARRAVMYTPVQGNREHGSVEISREKQGRNANCELLN